MDSQWLRSYLVAYRKKHNLTQTQLGKIIGASQAQVSRWEDGWVKPLKVRIENIIKKLHERNRR